MNLKNTFNLPPGISPIRMVQLPQPSTMCRPTLVRPPAPQPNRPILLLQRSQHLSCLLSLDQLIHPTPTQPSPSMTLSNSPHQALLQPSMGTTSSSPPSPHSTVVQPPMTTIPSCPSSQHSTVVQPSSRHSPSSPSGTSAKVARGRGGRTKRTAQKMEICVF